MGPLSMKIAALSRASEKRCFYFFSVAIIIDSFLFNLASCKEMLKTLDEFDFQPDPTTCCGISCPGVSEKYPITLHWESDVSILAGSCLIESSSKLLVTRSCTKA